MASLGRVVALLVAAPVLSAIATFAQGRIYNDPALVGARFAFDAKTWRMSPPDPIHGILLTRVADGFRPGMPP